MVKFDFHGKTAFVTGAASGIGRTVAHKLHEAGATLLLADLNEDALDAVANEIGANSKWVATSALDVTDPGQVEAAIQHAVDRFGGLDLAFNNAGIGGPIGSIEDIDVDAYRRLIDVNLNSVFYGMRYEVPAMLASGGGAIVNTSSILGLVAEPTAVPYTAAKHGVAGLTKAVAAGVASRGIRVNSVHPGYIETPLLKDTPPEAIEGLIAKHPIGRLGTTEEVANVVLFLLSDDASFVTGSQYTVDGAYTAV